MTLVPPDKVTVADGADVAQGSTSDAAWVSGSGTVIALLKKIASGGGGGGGGAVTVADGADVAQGTTTDASSANTVIGILKAIKAAVQGNITTTTSWVSPQHVIVDTAPTTAVTVASLPSVDVTDRPDRLVGVVSVASLPLPAGAAADASLAITNDHLASIRSSLNDLAFNSILQAEQGLFT